MSLIITDNGPPFLKAIAYLEATYGIRGIQISGYNSQANGKIERPHLDVRQVLYKACNGVASKWALYFPHIMWSDRVTTRRRMGCSPFFAVTGTHLVLPLDIVEATWLGKYPGHMLTTEEVIGYQARAWAKHLSDVAQLRSKLHEIKVRETLKYARMHAATIKQLNFKPGSLVLVRKTAIEKAIGGKMRPRYLGPVMVVRCTKGGSYIVAEMNGSTWGFKVAAFRVIPYMARKKIDLPDKLEALLDMSKESLDQLENSPEPVEEVPDDFAYSHPEYDNYESLDTLLKVKEA